jgi:hypothetical protein
MIVHLPIIAAADCARRKVSTLPFQQGFRNAGNLFLIESVKVMKVHQLVAVIFETAQCIPDINI